MSKRGGSLAKGPMDVLNPRYLWINRSTHSDVMSTATSISVYEVPAAPSKNNSLSRKINLPTFKGAARIPLIQIPAAKRSKALLKEREEFMARLARERDDRAELERWAATTIQALARGYLVRPHGPAVRGEADQAKQLEDSPATSALDPETLREQLARLTAETNFYMDLIGSESHPNWRKNVSKKAEGKKERRERKQIEKRAVKQIQRLARGFLGRRAFRTLKRRKTEEEKRRASVKIQQIARGFMARMFVQKRIMAKRNFAAIVVQRRARGWFGRSYARVYSIRLKNIQVEDNAAVKIQTLMRANMEKKQLERVEKEKAALRIQAIARGRRGRRTFKQKNEDKKKAAEELARLLKEQELAAVKMQSAMRAKLAKKQVTNRRDSRRRQHEQASALKIQAAARGRKGRQRYQAKVQKKRENSAALAIQKSARARTARKKVETKRQDKKENEAALKIQAIQRGKLGRKAYKDRLYSRQESLAAQQAEEAKNLQKEMFAASEEDKRRVEAAQEAAERRALEDAERAALEEAATAKIQAAARGRVGRKRAKEFRRKKIQDQKEKDAAISIQKLQRGKAARARMESQRRARRVLLEQQAENIQGRMRVREDPDSESESESDEEDM